MMAEKLFFTFTAALLILHDAEGQTNMFGNTMWQRGSTGTVGGNTKWNSGGATQGGWPAGGGMTQWPTGGSTQGVWPAGGGMTGWHGGAMSTKGPMNGWSSGGVWPTNMPGSFTQRQWPTGGTQGVWPTGGSVPGGFTRGNWPTGSNMLGGFTPRQWPTGGATQGVWPTGGGMTGGFTRGNGPTGSNMPGGFTPRQWPTGGATQGVWPTGGGMIGGFTRGNGPTGSNMPGGFTPRQWPTGGATQGVWPTGGGMTGGFTRGNGPTGSNMPGGFTPRPAGGATQGVWPTGGGMTGGFTRGNGPTGSNMPGGFTPRQLPTGGATQGVWPTGGGMTGGFTRGNGPTGSNMPGGFTPRQWPTGGATQGVWPTGGGMTGGFTRGNGPTGSNMPGGFTPRPTGGATQGVWPTGGGMTGGFTRGNGPTGSNMPGGFTPRQWPTGGATQGVWPTGGGMTGGFTRGNGPTGSNMPGGFTPGPWPTGGATQGVWPTGGGMTGGFTRGNGPTGSNMPGGFTPRQWPTGGATQGVWPTGGAMTGGFTRGNLPTGSNMPGGFTPGQWPIGGATQGVWPTGGGMTGGFTRGNWQTGSNMPGGFTPGQWPTGGATQGVWPTGGGMTGGFTRGNLPTGSNMPGGFTQSGWATGRTMSRMPGAVPTGGITQNVWPRVTSAPQLIRLNYDCPLECQFCRTWRSLSATCMAYDDYGNLKPEFERRMSARRRTAYDDAGQYNVWRITARTATCEGLNFYLDLWNSMTPRVRRNLITFINDPRSITVQEMRELPRMAAAILNVTVEDNMYNLMSLEQNKTMCEDIEYEDCLTRTLILRKIDCKNLMMSSAGSMSKDQFLSYLDDDKRQWTNDDWNTTIRYFADSLDYDDFEICPIDILIDVMRMIGDDCERLDKKTKETVMDRTSAEYDRIKAQYGSVPQATKDDWKYMVGKCGGSADRFMSKIDPQEALQTMDFRNLDDKNKWDTKDQIFASINIATMDKTTIANSISLMVHDTSMLDQLDDTTLESALEDICDAQTLEQDECRQLVSRVKKMSSFADASSMDASKVEKASCLMACYPPSDFNSIPQSSIQSALASGNLNMSAGTKDQIEKVKTAAMAEFNRPNGDFSADEVEKLGTCVLAFGAENLDKIPISSFTANVSSMIEAALNSGDMVVTPAVKRTLAEKVKQSRGISGVLTSKNLADSISVEDIANAAASDIPELFDESTEVTFDVDSTKASVLMKKLKSEIGDLSGSNFTLKRFQNLKKVLSGMTTEDIKNITADNTYLEKMHVIADAPNMNREQVKTVYDEYKKYTEFDSTASTTLSSNTDSSTIDKMSTGILAMHNSTELKKYGSSVCTSIIKKLTTMDTTMLTKTELKDKFDFFLDCLNKNSGTITKDDLDKAGKLICGFRSSRFNDMATDALESYVAYIDKYCSLDENERSELATTALNKLQLTDTSQITTKFAAILGTTIMELTETQLNNIDTTVLSSMTSTFAKELKEKETNDNKYEAAGLGKLVRNSTAKAEEKTKIQKLSRACLSAMSASSFSGRRKRSTTVYTCTQLQAIGTSGLSALTTDEINAFADSTFTDCAETLGSVTDWSSDQQSALVTVAKRNTVWGDPSTWSNTNVYSAGSIVQSLTSSEISTLTIDLDAISRLGTFSGWTDTSIANVFSRYLSLYKSNDASTLTSSELRSFGHATCGATTTHISQIPYSVYQASADKVGDVTSCQDLQLQEFATLAKAAYGSTVASWDTTTISTIGIVIGGLSKAEMATLSELQINAIAANDISYIPATAFTGLTVSQISTLSTSQAQATTTSQRNALSSDQLAALEAAAGVSFSSDGNSGNFLKSSFNTASLLIVAAILLPKY